MNLTIPFTMKLTYCSDQTITAVSVSAITFELVKNNGSYPIYTISEIYALWSLTDPDFC